MKNLVDRPVNKFVSWRVLGKWLLLVVVANLTACAWMDGAPRQKNTATSLVDFLYHDQKQQVIEPGIPHLRLPLNVGVAFVPGTGHFAGEFTEAQKMLLMERVAQDFRQHEYVNRVELVPSAYLRFRGGFTNLDQLRSLLGIDVIVLISYDQQQFTDESKAAIAYWTLVGAYIVRGEKLDVHTLMDAAVYDIESRRLLFRAPGTSLVKNRSTLQQAREQQRRNAAEGFDQASEQLALNLAVEMQKFAERVKESPKEYKVSRRSGSSGGGSLGLGFLLLLTLVGFRFTTKSPQQVAQKFL